MQNVNCYYGGGCRSRGAIRIRKSKKEGQDNALKKKKKRTNNDLQNIMQNTKDKALRAPPKAGDVLMCIGKVSSFCSTSVTVVVLDSTK
jgi:hypothetical protein